MKKTLVHRTPRFTGLQSQSRAASGRNSNHLFDRTRDRIAAAGIDARRLEMVTAWLAGRTDCDTAVLLVTLPATIGTKKQADGTWSPDSNGNQVWLIIRDNVAITSMFRRETQPATTQALRVDRVVLDPAAL